MQKPLLLALVFFTLSGALLAQGITTSAINGIVRNSDGEELPGATVLATHVPTGTQYGVVTNAQGKFYFPNVRVGGPYTLNVTFIGFKTYEENEFSLALGENRGLTISLVEESQTLEEVVVTDNPDDQINSGRTGASTHISTSTIERNPSISRSLNDFTRLTPQAASGLGNGGTSIAGRNSRYNNLTIDGAVNNDAFGLNSSGQPGSNAGTEIVSLDAIKEVSIVVSPYDVTQGSFSGGGINAVTRSGTNEVEASVYYFVRNERFMGKTLGEDRKRQAPFTNKQYGARFGTPIIKNKLFFFGSFEQQKAETPFAIRLVDQATLNNFDEIPANISLISMEEAQAVKDHLENVYGYNPGSYGRVTPMSENNKVFARLDWNINNKHQLTLRHNYVRAEQDDLSRSQLVLEFSRHGFVIDYTNNSTILELNSRFSQNLSNRFIAGFTTVDDNRDVSSQNDPDLGGLFPHLDINLGSNRVIRAGGQRSSQGNLKSQDILQITDNFTLFKDKHTITFGTHNEYYKIFNSFVNRYNGHYEYASLADFQNDQLGSATSIGRFRLAYSLDYFNDRFNAVELRFLQTGFYAQDEFDAGKGLRLTAGIRVDIPVFIDKPNRNGLLENEFGLDTRDVPSGQLLWSPRFGFNYNINEESVHQLRGGVGIFTGRIPFVWVANQYTNSGATLATLDIRANRGGIMPLYGNGNRILEQYYADQLNVGIDDPAVRTRIEEELKNIPTSEVNLMSRNFRMPQVFRANLAYDVKLPYGVVATVEGIYTKTLNEINYENINLTYPLEKVIGEGRPRHVGSLANSKFQNVLLINNTNKGYQYSLSGSLQKNWNEGLFAMIAYNYGQSRDVNSGTNTTALSGWEFNPTPGYSNDQHLSYSVWDLRHRVVGNISYRKEWLGFMASTLSIYYNGQSGEPFSYTINGDVNGDGAAGNDLVYVPRHKNEILLVPLSASDTRTADQIWQELNSFIMRDDYLSNHRGQFAARNAARTPWESRFDVRFMHEFFTEINNHKHTIQLSLDIENFANLLDQDFGRDYFVLNNTYNLMSFQGYEGANNTGRPVYSFDASRKEAWQVNNVTSVWRMQFGVRYIF